MSSYARRLEKLNRYLQNIDRAILEGRYTLARRLAYRCLNEYYFKFLRTRVPNYKNWRSTRLMSIYISRYIMKYFRANRIPVPENNVAKIALATNSIENNMDTEADRASATFARDTMTGIVRFLCRFM